jgi:hypothetical protein
VPGILALGGAEQCLSSSQLYGGRIPGKNAWNSRGKMSPYEQGLTDLIAKVARQAVGQAANALCRAPAYDRVLTALNRISWNYFVFGFFFSVNEYLCADSVHQRVKHFVNLGRDGFLLASERTYVVDLSFIHRRNFPSSSPSSWDV